MKIYKEKDYDAVSKRAAALVAAQMKEKNNSILGLATGSSPVGMYKELVDMYNAGEISFKKIRTVNLDEYAGLADDDVNSYHYFMNQHLFSKVDIDPANTHLPNGIAADPEAECASYEAMVQSLGGTDLQVLGLGENGHIGFNEPGTPFTEVTHLVDLTESTIHANSRLFEKIEDVPRQAYSMGIKTIMSAKRILLIVTGTAKADALAKVINGPVTVDVPGSILQTHPDVTVICDEAAASKL
ncbi:glucosamine-6-phosphate deaminase [Pseudobutyrivibrio ruminis]|uniref:glucosamine-6-phosphate deaminase n=1 Tax=Pseudobutyrivibrio ruminis TaxID=46206 RepID=UPI00051C35C0|nr:glucosamine-6-phosphate deaminase [Pseudobutyrivibrio ruminis]